MELFKHQSSAVEHSKKSPFLLIIRSPGTGKTLIGTTIAQEELQNNAHAKILWIGPANLENQYKNVFDTLALPYNSVSSARNIKSGCCNICSFDILRLHEPLFCNMNWDLVLIDEVHKAKNSATKTNKSLWHLRKKAKRWYAFTGTPFQNNPYEFFELVSLCRGHQVTFNCEKCLMFRSPKKTPVRDFFRRMGFKISRVNQGPIIGIKNPQQLSAILKNYVDYIPREYYHSECHLPQVNINYKDVVMTAEELHLYQQYEKKCCRKKKFKSFASDNLDDASIDGYFHNISVLRTVAMAGSKTEAAIELLKTIIQEQPEAKILIFSNFVEKGLKILSEKLDKIDLPHLFYHGEINPQRRNSFVESYLSGQKNIMLLSPVGFEGLDLYGTTHVIILDPHYNPERTEQLISRAVRAYSFVQEINVIQLLSVSKNRKIIDQSIVDIAERKRNLGKLLKNTLAV